MSVEFAGRPLTRGATIGARPGAVSASSAYPAGVLALRLIAFFALAWVAAAAYATLLRSPPHGRVLAAALLASVAGLALSLLARAPWSPLLQRLLACGIVVVAFALVLTLLGVPLRLLAPERWGQLAGDIEHGVHGANGALWPYVGSDRWTRLTVLLLLAPGLTLASALCFWPSAWRYRERRLLALGVLVGLIVAGMANVPPGAWRVQGLLLTVLIFAWYWLPTLSVGEAGRAGGWLLVCVVPALLAAPLLAGEGGWLEARTAPGAPRSVAFQWDQLFGPIASSRSTAAMVTVSAPAPALLRVTSLDTFDGTRFIRSAAPAATRRLDLRPERAAHGSTERTTITVGALRSSLLVGGAGVTEGVRWPAQYATNATTTGDGTVSLARPLASGARYEVDSYLPGTGTSELRDAPLAFPSVYDRYTQFELPGATAAAAPFRVRGTRRPPNAATGRLLRESPYAPMFALARGLAGGGAAPYEVARRIERYLQSNYSYTEAPPRRRYPLEAFLFTDRRGYCQQFAGAMTLMLRMDGIPARVGVGFKPTRRADPTSAWAVTAADAHAWSEAYFTGIGWVSFDPTPARQQSETGTGGAFSKSALLSNRAESRGHAPRRLGRAAGGGGGGVSGWVLLSSFLAICAGLALAGWLLRGTRRASHALDDGAAPGVAELRTALLCAGWPERSRRTLAAIASTLRLDGRVDAAEYVELLREARFAAAPAATGGQDSLHAVAEGRAALRRALLRRGGTARRIRTLVSLPPAIAGGRPR
jgi:transglutaminase-like putative cysteine protease